MNEQTGTSAPWWSEQELAILQSGLAAGHTPQQIAARLPQRSLEAVKTRCRLLGRMTGKYTAPVRPMAGTAVRVRQLEKVIVAAASEKRADEAYLKELRTGYIVLRWRQHQDTRIPLERHRKAQERREA